MKLNSIFGLENKNVVMTGGSGGVGQASARLFALTAGANVALISRRGSDELVEQVSAEGGAIKSYRADITSRSELDSVFKDIDRDFGDIHCLLNISGVCDFYSPDSSVLEKTQVNDERWEKIVGVNGKGVALAIEFAVARMIDGGSIVNVGSTAGRFGAELAVVDYSFAKAGLVGMTMAYAKILGDKGIRVNAVAPGPIEGTEMLAEADADVVKGLKSQTRLNRLCLPEDIANINLFLASTMSSSITGEVIDSNCGQYICY